MRIQPRTQAVPLPSPQVRFTGLLDEDFDLSTRLSSPPPQEHSTPSGEPPRWKKWLSRIAIGTLLLGSGGAGGYVYSETLRVDPLQNQVVMLQEEKATADQAKTDLETKVTELEKLDEQYQEALSHIEDVNAKLETQVKLTKSVEAERDAAKSEAAAKSELVTRLEAEKKELEAQVKTLTEEKAALTAQVADLEAKLKAANEEIATLKNPPPAA